MATRGNKQSVWLEEYDITSFLVDFKKKLSLFGLLNLLQESAWRHADHLGHGYRQTRDAGTSWVLARQRIEVESWPDWGDKLVVRTWLRPPSAVVVTRDFQLTVGGREIGQASAHWVTIDHRTRRPTPLPFTKDSSQFRQEGHLSINPRKVHITRPLKPVAQFQVQQSDLDMNGHVNNTRFSQWILDSLPTEAHQSHILKLYEINFLAEACLGDLVEILGSTQADKLLFQGRRVGDGKLLFATEVAGTRA